jgi:hypothetical protein
MLSFKNKMLVSFNEWKEQGRCTEAIKLNKVIGEEYFCESNPHFFTGDLNAELVLIHLNPKRNKNNKTGKFDFEKPNFESFDEYFDYFRYFGRYNYGKNSDRTHRSPFDKKQVRFIKPLNILPISAIDQFKDLEIVMDNKLQIELIPFGSESFNFNKVGLKNIEPYIENILSLITSKKRKLVIFCGRVFDTVLSNYVVNKIIHEFKLEKKDGTLTFDNYHFIELELKYNNIEFKAIIAPQFAMQGMPIEKYGMKLNEILQK